jgi:quercetin dioxygenase-like cupin family protein
MSGFTIVHRDDVERNGNWSLLRRALGLNSFGMGLVEIAAGASIPPHDETGRDQEEVFIVLSGSPTLVIDGEDHAAPEGTYARVDVEHTRTVRNDGSEPASVLIVSAPRTSGYEAMDWN